MRKPDFFIVGAPKCGTTAMYAFLRQHPDIFMPEVKEPHFFGSDLINRYGIQDETKYLALFAPATTEKRLGEGSVWYLYSQAAAREIKAYCPEARIIIMLRNPVDALYSLHSQRLRSGDETIMDFREALLAEADRKRGRRIPKWTQVVQGMFYSETIRYAEQVERYFDVFGRERVRVILYDDFKQDPAEVYADTLRFLEVDPTFTPRFEVVNESRRLRSYVLRRMMKSPGLRACAKVMLPAGVRHTASHRIRRLNTAPSRAKPLDPELRAELKAQFAPEIEKLSLLLGRDLSHWGSAARPSRVPQPRYRTA